MPSTSIRCEMEAACGAGLQDQLRVYCATNRLNPVDEYPLERLVERVYFAPDTSTSVRCEMQPVEPLETTMAREGKVTV